MSRHRSQDEAPTDDLAMLQPGDLVSVHLVGPAGDEGFFTGEVKAPDNATGPPVVVIEGADIPDDGELTRLVESNDQLQADLREARMEIERCHERVRELVSVRDDSGRLRDQRLEELDEATARAGKHLDPERSDAARE